VQVVSVRGERRLSEGTTVDVVEDLSREFAARQLAVVLNRGRSEIEAVVTFVLGHNSLCSTGRELSAGQLTFRRRNSSEFDVLLRVFARSFEVMCERGSVGVETNAVVDATDSLWRWLSRGLEMVRKFSAELLGTALLSSSPWASRRSHLVSRPTAPRSSPVSSRPRSRSV